jgi:predicted MFS family arabinose efflux permease
MTGVGSVVGPRLADRLGGKIRAVVLTQSASLIFLLLIGFAPWLGLVFFSFLMRSVLMNMSVPLYHTFAMEQVIESEQGTVNSVLEWSWQFGWMIGPYISGVVQQFYGFSPLFIATAVTYGLANVATWVYFHRHDQEELALSSSTIGV